MNQEINLDYDSGVYLLEIFLHKPKKIEVGALGFQTFPPGYYYYAGTAQKNLGKRLERHYSTSKKVYWHVDYLLAEGYLKNHYTWPLEKKGECRLAYYLEEELNGEIIVPGFGSSDCECKSHLIYFSNPLNENELPEKKVLSTLNEQ